MSKHLGSISFSSVPDVNGDLLLTGGVGSTNQLVVTKSENVLSVSFADNPIIPGVEKLRLPVGTTLQRSETPAFGDTRANSNTGVMEFFNGTAWVPPGSVLKVTDVDILAASGTSTVPLDNSAPSGSEGWQFFNVSYTPLSTNSKLIIEYTITTSSTVASSTIVASVFAGSNNLGSVAARMPNSANTAVCMAQKVVYLNTTGAPVSISGRIGSTAASTTRVNLVGTNTLGGTLVSTATITEVVGGQ